MKFDSRCIQLTIRRNTAVPQMLIIEHGPDCRCDPYPVVVKSVPVKFVGSYREYCPCGAKQHKGMCKDALLQEQGREASKWNHK